MNDSLGDRMKVYESCGSFSFPRRMPLIVRLDGRAFHTFTRDMPPFDQTFQNAMREAARATAEEMQGFVLGYTQSDEVSFLLQDWATLTTEPWFGKQLNKIISIAAATMSVHFTDNLRDYREQRRVAVFDARAFVLPEAEVANYFLWRAKDCARNSIQTFAREHFSHADLYLKGIPEIHEMLHGIGKNWTDLAGWQKNGLYLYKVEVADLHGTGPMRTTMAYDDVVLPIFMDVDNLVKKALDVALRAGEA